MICQDCYNSKSLLTACNESVSKCVGFRPLPLNEKAIKLKRIILSQEAEQRSYVLFSQGYFSISLKEGYFMELMAMFDEIVAVCFDHRLARLSI